MTTIEDVARITGLSRTTISRVMNNHPYVALEKRKKVQEAMEELGYVPNSAARQLRKQKTETIAVIIPRITNPFFSSLVETLELEASKYNYRLIMCQTAYKEEKELDYLELLSKKQVDGILLCSIHNEWDKIKGYLKDGPIVLVNEYSKEAEIPMVKLDQVEGAYLATKHLLEQGHTSLVFCKGNSRNIVGHDRERGFRKAISEAGLDPDKQYYFESIFNFEDGAAIFTEMMKLPNVPTAVFTGSDEVAVGLISEAKKNGWGVPDKLAVIGYDNQIISKFIEPALTTVEQPVQRLAAKALAVLMDKIRSKNYVGKEIYEYPTQLIIRNSTTIQ